MSCATEINDSTHDGTVDRFSKRRCPLPVKMVAAVMLLLAAVNISHSLFFRSIPVLAGLAFCKGLVGIAAAIGLLRLRDGWRFFVLIITGLGVLILPFYFLAIVLSADISRWVSEMSGIDSRSGIALFIALAFVAFFWTARTLVRPDVERAFYSVRNRG